MLINLVFVYWANNQIIKQSGYHVICVDILIVLFNLLTFVKGIYGLIPIDGRSISMLKTKIA